MPGRTDRWSGGSLLGTWRSDGKSPLAGRATGARPGCFGSHREAVTQWPEDGKHTPGLSRAVSHGQRVVETCPLDLAGKRWSIVSVVSLTPGHPIHDPGGVKAAAPESNEARGKSIVGSSPTGGFNRSEIQDGGQESP